jgi:CDP-diglyceride synthetase
VVVGALIVLLLATTAVRAWRLWRCPEDPERRARWRSVGSWWGLLLVAVAVLVLGPWSAMVAGGILALLLLSESLSLVRAWHPSGLTPARAFVAGALALAAPTALVVTAWLPTPDHPPGARMGWLLATVVLTGLNDSAQAWWGRRIGRHRLAPLVSPGKTWEGLAGGVVITALAAVWVLPLLTPVGREAVGPMGSGRTAGVIPGYLVSAALGTLLAVAGTVGDLTVSIVKRRAGADDSGSLLPGQGGLLDRFDSLTVTAVLMAGVARGLYGG